MKKPKTTQPKDAEQIRDKFYTPDYATDLIVPFLENLPVWEPAAGGLKIALRLVQHGYSVRASDLTPPDPDTEKADFLTSRWEYPKYQIVTNPPYSQKKEFLLHCFALTMPFALLIPFDMSQWMAEAFSWGCKAVVPTRRIDYITPTGKQGKASAAQFHSIWLTWKLPAVPDQITIVQLTKEMKKNI